MAHVEIDAVENEIGIERQYTKGRFTLEIGDSMRGQVEIALDEDQLKTLVSEIAGLLEPSAFADAAADSLSPDQIQALADALQATHAELTAAAT